MSGAPHIRMVHTRTGQTTKAPTGNEEGDNVIGRANWPFPTLCPRYVSRLVVQFKVKGEGWQAREHPENKNGFYFSRAQDPGVWKKVPRNGEVLYVGDLVSFDCVVAKDKSSEKADVFRMENCLCDLCQIVFCPICNQKFLPQLIERHANECLDVQYLRRAKQPSASIRATNSTTAGALLFPRAAVRRLPVSLGARSTKQGKAILRKRLRNGGLRAPSNWGQPLDVAVKKTTKMLENMQGDKYRSDLEDLTTRGRILSNIINKGEENVQDCLGALFPRDKVEEQIGPARSGLVDGNLSAKSMLTKEHQEPQWLSKNAVPRFNLFGREILEELCAEAGLDISSQSYEEEPATTLKKYWATWKEVAPQKPIVLHKDKVGHIEQGLREVTDRFNQKIRDEYGSPLKKTRLEEFAVLSQ